MNKWIKIIAILAVVGLVAAGLVWKFVINKPHADIENTMPAYSLNAQELWKQYNQELKLSDSLYTGKVIEITGNLSKIDKVDSLVYLVFVMEPDPDFGDKTIRCEMLPKYNEEASKAIVKAPLKVKGFCSGYDQTDIKFSKCSIIK
ncbi:MAG: OB-fold protein [Bacteroidales bacterium]